MMNLNYSRIFEVETEVIFKSKIQGEYHEEK